MMFTCFGTSLHCWIWTSWHTFLCTVWHFFSGTVICTHYMDVINYIIIMLCVQESCPLCI